MSTFTNPNPNPNPAEEQTPASEFIGFPDELTQSQERDPWEVVDEPAQHVIDAMADALIERQLREREAEQDEADENEENETDEPCGDEEYSEPRAPKEPQIKVVVFSPDDWPRVTIIDNTLSALQRLVGGLIEVFPVGIDGVIGAPVKRVGCATRTLSPRICRATASSAPHRASFVERFSWPVMASTSPA